MCGIFGISIDKDSKISDEKFKQLFRKLFVLSESRGKEASGFAGITDDKIVIHKSPLTAGRLVRTAQYKELLERISRESGSKTLIGHSRLVTNGYEHFNKNNQPVTREDFVAVHNGIIVNYRALWSELDTEPKSDLDSEIIPAMLSKMHLSNDDLLQNFTELFRQIEGMTSTALLHVSSDTMLLATNNGSVYYSTSSDKSIFLFASEHYILEKVLLDEFKDSPELFNPVKQLKPWQLLVFEYNKKNLRLESLTGSSKKLDISKRDKPYQIETIAGETAEDGKVFNTSFEFSKVNVPDRFEKQYAARKDIIDNLKKCSKCILPESFPFISFDKDGVCNYCNNYKKINYKGSDKLQELARRIRKNDDRPDCLVPFSGGRDSSYVLHFLVKELGLKPLAFSYDWGMITDLARRNQSRLCGKLGVEHILVSADIRRKRKFIRENVLAWLKKPDLGMVPLFMAGDKQYFYYTQKLLKENNLDISFLGENLLETTNFKSGFAGIKPGFEQKNTYTLSLANKVAMLAFYAKHYMTNPAYINSSLFDTLGSFKSYYLIKHSNINLFDYIEWDEERIIKVIKALYDWETDPGTETTWRIGDGTAAFYNYIYYMVAGFNENNTFRSNQIREGQLEREKALNLIYTENLPRWDSIRWYCSTIGIDFEKTVDRINEIPTLFDKGNN